MLVSFNIVLILLVALIAYWWANQGFFSALLHLLCVIVAGVIALAAWEPLTMPLLRGGMFDNYVWGMTLIIPFAIVLFVLRLALDKLAPANVQIPHWANLTFGGIAGAGAGVLSIGIFLIGAGFIQSPSEIVGFRGHARDTKTARIAEINGLWLPVHRWTSDFYSLLSVGSMRTSRPLKQYNPELWKQSWGLVRDSFENGKGQLALKPSEAEVKSLAAGASGDRWYVGVNFKAGARDHGEMLTLSNSQIRLIGNASGTGAPQVVHPDAWTQSHKQGIQRHQFDDKGHYISSEPAKSNLATVMEFATPTGFVPRFIQIRNTRYSLPEAQTGTELVIEGGARSAMDFSGSPLILPNELQVSNTTRGINMSANTMPAGLKIVNIEGNRFLTEGEGEIPKNMPRPSRQLAIKGIYEPDGARVVQLTIKRNSNTDVYGLMATVGGDQMLALVDSDGNEFFPIGYIWYKPDLTFIKLDPTNYTRTAEDLPNLPSSGRQSLNLIFYVTSGSTITGFRYGDIPVGRANQPVGRPR